MDVSYLSLFSNFYVKEMYGLNPLNPLLTSAEYLAEGLHSLESTSLALSGCVLMTGGAYIHQILLSNNLNVSLASLLSFQPI